MILRFVLACAAIVAACFVTFTPPSFTFGGSKEYPVTCFALSEPGRGNSVSEGYNNLAQEDRLDDYVDEVHGLTAPEDVDRRRALIADYKQNFALTCDALLQERQSWLMLIAIGTGAALLLLSAPRQTVATKSPQVDTV